jgi:uncharacterized membrane protein
LLPLAISANVMETIGRWHVALVHFPIALMLLGGGIEFSRMIFRRRGISSAAVLCITIGTVAAIVTSFAGWVHADFGNFAGDQARTLWLHRWTGLAAACAGVLSLFLLIIARRGIYWPFQTATVVGALLVGVAGHFGGSLTHGNDYLTELLYRRSTFAAGSAQPVSLEKITYPADGKIDFVAHVQPILAARCYTCHGPEKRRGGLRLDSKTSVFLGGNSGPAVAAGHADQSVLLRRVLGLGNQKRMPVNAPPLSDEQIRILRTWIDQGATWPSSASHDGGAEEKHWAYIKPVRPNLPAVKDTNWPRNPIDYFILARLEAEGLAPSPEADRITLIRRLSLDLTGLPPTPQEVDDYLADQSSNAYEKVVERLLASPHYGERWGRHWLDIARYADTNGYEKDNPRSIWPYRDWVIRAINQDLPFDQFVIDQVAGDMLPNATLDQKIASGFHRNTMFSEEGGVDIEEFRFKSIVDRVQTTSAAFLGLTLQCAQCHNHKYDQFTQKEYYQLFAFLNNCDEPQLELPAPDIAAKRAAIETQIANLHAQLESEFPTHDPTLIWETLTPSEIKTKSAASVAMLDDRSLLLDGPRAETDSYTFETTSDLTDIVAFKLETLVDSRLPKGGPGRADGGNFVISEFKVSVDNTPAKLISAEADYSQPQYDVAEAIDGDPKTGWAVADPGGKINRNHFATFRLEKQISPGKGRIVITIDQNHPNHSLGRFRILAGRARPLPVTTLSPEQLRAQYLAEKLSEWEKSTTSKCVKWNILDPRKYSRRNEATITKLDDRSLLFTGDNYYREQYDLEFPVEQPTVSALRIEVLPDARLPSQGPGRNPRGGFLVTEVTAQTDPGDGRASPAPVEFISASANISADTAPRVIDGKLDTHWTIPAGPDGPCILVLQLKNPVTFARGGRLLVSIGTNYFQAENPGRVRVSAAGDARPAEASGLPADLEDTMLIPPAKRSAEQQNHLKQFFLETTPLLAAQQKKLTDLRASMPAFDTTLVMQERQIPRTTSIHRRGEYLQPESPVEPGVPAVLHPFPAGAPRNRLGLAMWLVDENNPLIGRVVINRVWNRYFGRGLVNTVDDFGVMGERPSHPQLLDWLATEFIRQHWSMKAMHRLIVTSATYRQSSHVRPELQQKDPSNVLLARAPRLRVEAEIVRDTALAASGLLSAKVGGPSVFPPQPSGVSELSYGVLPWKTSAGTDRYRRGMYTFLKRTSPYPGLIVFDAPTSETTCTRRLRSDTPLQALTVMNDEVFMEASQAMARRIVAHGGDVAARARYAFRLCVARSPEPSELSRLLSFYQAQLARFHDRSADPAAVALADPKQPPEGMDVAELAAWTTVSRSILNLDETCTKE